MSSRWWWVVNFTSRPPCTLGRDPGTLWMLGGPQSRNGRSDQEKKALAPDGNRSSASSSPWRSQYTYYAIAALILYLRTFWRVWRTASNKDWRNGYCIEKHVEGLDRLTRLILPVIGLRTRENSENPQSEQPVSEIYRRDLTNSKQGWHIADRDIWRISAKFCYKRRCLVFFTDYCASMYPTPGRRQQEEKNVGGRRSGRPHSMVQIYYRYVEDTSNLWQFVIVTYFPCPIKVCKLWRC
jgi:hypothetical protein